MINHKFLVVILFITLAGCLILNFKEFSKHEKGIKSNAEFSIITSMMIIDFLSIILLKLAVRTEDIDTNALIIIAIIFLTFALLYIVNIKTILWMHTVPMILIAVVTIVANAIIYTNFLIPTLVDVASISNSFEVMIKLIVVILTGISIISGFITKRKRRDRVKQNTTGEEESYDE